MIYLILCITIYTLLTLGFAWDCYQANKSV
jgi:hypothetical protein